VTAANPKAPEPPAFTERPDALFEVARALAEALTADEVATALFDHALSTLGANSVGLWLVGPDGVIRFSAGAGEGGSSEVGDIPPESDLPAAVAMRTGEVVVFGDREERDERWPVLHHIRSDTESVVVLLLSARGRRMGVMHIGWRERGNPLGPGLPLLHALADLCAGALDRAQLHDAERRARETLEFLSQGTRLMVSALDPDMVIQSLVRLAVPRLAPWCAVYVAEDDKLVRTAVEMAGAEELAGAVRAAGPLPVDAPVSVAEAYRTGQVIVVPAMDPDQVHAIYGAELANRILSLPGAPWSALIVPIEAVGQTIGVMSLQSPEWTGGMPPAEVRFAAAELAGRAGMSLRNARRYRAQVDSVALLSAALLPAAMPKVDGHRFTARYVPSAGGDVSGDWYEAELMPGGLLLVGIGDASGHGVPAAATMAHVRNAARGLAVAGIRPGRMLEHLSELVMQSSDDHIATALYGLLDPATGTGVWANAGHPPPIAVRPDGEVVLVSDMVAGAPIGSGRHDYGQTALGVEPGGRLVLYTDGLFERRGEDPSDGLARLLGVVREVVGSGGDLDAAAVDHALASELVSSRLQTEDDGCVLVIGRDA